jgi:hypothetical protein
MSTDCVQDVAELQRMLIRAGHYAQAEAPTGYFGAYTKLCVEAWQRSEGAQVTGDLSIVIPEAMVRCHFDLLQTQTCTSPPALPVWQRSESQEHSLLTFAALRFPVLSLVACMMPQYTIWQKRWHLSPHLTAVTLVRASAQRTSRSSVAYHHGSCCILSRPQQRFQSISTCCIKPSEPEF